MKIDSHQHFWKYQPLRDTWITDEMKKIRHDFMPEDLRPILEKNGFEGCVAIQADQSEEETMFLLDLAEKNPFIKGVVGWVDLRRKDIEDKLAHFAAYKKLKGFRHIVQAETDPDFLIGKEFTRGIGHLKTHNFTFDLLIKPHQLKSAIQLVNRFPDQPFVIDHLAKPYVRERQFLDWNNEMEEIAQFENVYCKISGLVTEADWYNWDNIDFRPFIDAAIDHFGTHGLMFGSDWPMCLLGATFEQVCEIVEKNTSYLSEEERESFWGLNAHSFYHL